MGVELLKISEMNVNCPQHIVDANSNFHANTSGPPLVTIPKEKLDVGVDEHFIETLSRMMAR